MNDRSFETITRNAAGGISGRRSLITLGAAGLAAGLASPFAAEAKKASPLAAEGKKGGKHKRKDKKQKCPPAAVDRCPGQVETCTATLTAVCGGNPECQDAVACCPHLRTCDASGYFACLILAGSN